LDKNSAAKLDRPLQHLL